MSSVSFWCGVSLPLLALILIPATSLILIGITYASQIAGVICICIATVFLALIFEFIVIGAFSFLIDLGKGLFSLVGTCMFLYIGILVALVTVVRFNTIIFTRVFRSHE